MLVVVLGRSTRWCFIRCRCLGQPAGWWRPEEYGKNYLTPAQLEAAGKVQLAGELRAISGAAGSLTLLEQPSRDRQCSPTSSGFSPP